jgi:glutamate racemase
VIHEVLDSSSIIDSAVETGKALKEVLCESPLLNTSGVQGAHKFFVTDSTEKFVAVGERFLGREIREIEKIQL